MPWTNYHSHTVFSDGHAEPEVFIQEAIRQGVKSYGFSCHAPLPFETTWCMREEYFEAYTRQIEGLKEKYHHEIEIYRGLEVDYLPGVSPQEGKAFHPSKLDYFVASVHFVGQYPEGEYWTIDGDTTEFARGLDTVYKGDIRRAVENYFELEQAMIRSMKPPIVGHVDKIKMHNGRQHFFDETEGWYREMLYSTLDLIAREGNILEISTRGMGKGFMNDFYPSQWCFDYLRERKIKLTISSDCHRPSEITYGFAQATTSLLSAGINKVWALHKGRWQPFMLTPDGVMI